VYAGRADALGLRATLPAVATALDRGAGSLLAAASTALAAGRRPTAGGPVFGTLSGGLQGLVDALVAGAAVRPRLGRPVRGLARTPQGWRLQLGSTSESEHLDADAVVLAVPAPAAAQALPDSSGVLVAASEPLSVKAFTFSGRKWTHASSAEVLLVRASMGRHGEVRVLQRDDAELVDAARADLAALTGITATPVATVVARWGGGLPQYAPGHLDAVAALEREIARSAGLAVAGATLHGVGLPACIGTANSAARRIVGYLNNRRVANAVHGDVEVPGGTMGP
jgi:oxygen-dependent protoporphyrinogen oxidase